MRTMLFLAFIVLTGDARAMDDLERMKLAMNLGSVLASEAPCDLSYDHTAIEKFIDERVEADDMDFASSLTTMTSGAEYEIGQMTPAAKAAHCRQISRVAKSFNFVQ